MTRILRLSRAGSLRMLLIAGLAVPAVAVTASAQIVTAEERSAVVERIATLLDERYVFPDIAVAAGKHLRAELERGAFDTQTDPKQFAAALTGTLQSVSKDKHMRVFARPGEITTEAQPDPIVEHARMMRSAIEENYGFVRVERFEGNVGYLDLRGFAAPVVPGARDAAVAAMRLLAGSDAVIVDLRKNGGGSPEMVRLICSYFFGERTHLNSLYWRQGDRTEEFWTLDEVPGEKMADVPLFVLTSGHTFSGAEEFSYNMQTRKRATLVGETTGGGANPGGGVPINGRFGIFVPTGKAINPVTKTNWEGTGVKPEVAVSAETAYEKGLELARKAASERRLALDARHGEARQQLTRELSRALELFERGNMAEGTATVERALDAARSGGLVEEGLINMTGYSYLGREKLAMAIAVFEYNVKAYPASSNVYDSLGEALMKAGQKERAITNYNRSLELDPRNDNARAMLKTMGAR